LSLSIIDAVSVAEGIALFPVTTVCGVLNDAAGGEIT